MRNASQRAIDDSLIVGGIQLLTGTTYLLALLVLTKVTLWVLEVEPELPTVAAVLIPLVVVLGAALPAARIRRAAQIAAIQKGWL